MNGETLSEGGRMQLTQEQEAVESLRLKFTSANDIPVQRATITRKGWESILAILSMQSEEVEKLRYENGIRKADGDRWTAEIQRALDFIPKQFVGNDEWENGVKRMADWIDGLAKSCADFIEQVAAKSAEVERLRMGANKAYWDLGRAIVHLNTTTSEEMSAEFKSVFEGLAALLTPTEGERG